MSKAKRNYDDEDNEEGEGGGHDNSGGLRWLLTYSDMITLLMAFFIVMYAMSQIDTAKYQSLSKSMGQALGGTNYIGMQSGGLIPGAEGGTELAGKTTEDSLEQIANDLTDYANNNDLSGKVSFFLSEEGLNISFTGSVLFDKGKADLRPEAIPALKEVANYLHKVPNYIGVAGSTDDLKISTEQFPSNWELSVIRATTVVRFLVEKEGIDPHRIIALGYGEYHLLYPNINEVNRSKNRRIDIIIYKSPPFLGN